MGSDVAFDVLMPYLMDCCGQTLWIADENSLAVVASVPPHSHFKVLSNRFDVFRTAQSAGHVAEFSDFDLSQYADKTVQRIVYRISKEKPVVHHVLNEACRLLAADGDLIVAGYKDEGTKTYLQKCKGLFRQVNNEKNGPAYIGVFSGAFPITTNELLDDQDYRALRLIDKPALSFYSKPGLFGWDRIDVGSAFLVAALLDYLKGNAWQADSLLDLGCGYGYLTLATAHLPFARRVATDNNAAAIEAMKRNAEFLGITVEVIADDAGANIKERFDLIVCNPPFHQGFDVSGDLTNRFLKSAQRLLSSHGSAIFVVNSFVGLEKKAQELFTTVTILATNPSFKVILLRH